MFFPITRLLLSCNLWLNLLPWAGRVITLMVFAAPSPIPHSYVKFPIIYFSVLFLSRIWQACHPETMVGPQPSQPKDMPGVGFYPILSYLIILSYLGFISHFPIHVSEAPCIKKYQKNNRYSKKIIISIQNDLKSKS